MQLAVERVVHGLSVRRVSKEMGLPRETLRLKANAVKAKCFTSKQGSLSKSRITVIRAVHIHINVMCW